MKKVLFIFLSLFVSWSNAQNIGAAEYFIDGPDPGLGNGMPLTVNSNSGTLSQEFNIPTAGLSEGFHSLYVRTQIAGGNWSLFDRTSFYITSVYNENEPIASAEYFFDVDPGVGNGTPLSINGNTGKLVQNFTIPTMDLTPGLHGLYIRTQNTNGTWSFMIDIFFT